MRQLWIIEYENAHWCGGVLNCVVWAEDEDEAIGLAEDHMEQEQRELFSSEYEEEQGLDEEAAHTVISCEPLVGSEYEQYYNDPVQRANFYPCVNDE